MNQRNKRIVEKKNNGLSGTKACVLDRDIKRAQLKNGEGDEEKKLQKDKIIKNKRWLKVKRCG